MALALIVLVALALGAPHAAAQESYTYKYSTNWFGAYVRRISYTHCDNCMIFIKKHTKKSKLNT